MSGIEIGTRVRTNREIKHSIRVKKSNGFTLYEDDPKGQRTIPEGINGVVTSIAPASIQVDFGGQNGIHEIFAGDFDGLDLV